MFYLSVCKILQVSILMATISPSSQYFKEVYWTDMMYFKQVLLLAGFELCHQNQTSEESGFACACIGGHADFSTTSAMSARDQSIEWQSGSHSGIPRAVSLQHGMGEQLW